LTSPGQLGRVLRNRDGTLSRIVEARDARPEELEVHEINTGIYLFRATDLRGWVARMEPENAQREYYITDCLAMAAQDGKTVYCHTAHSRWEWLA